MSLACGWPNRGAKRYDDSELEDLGDLVTGKMQGGGGGNVSGK
jgi:hypothetical protein